MRLLDNAVRSGQVKLLDIHWDGHQFCCKGLVASSTGPGWKFGRGETIRGAVAAFTDELIGDDLV